MRDIACSPVTHDMVVINGDMALVDGIDQIMQNIKIRLLFISEEWFLDTTKGVMGPDILGIKNPNLSVIDALLKTTIIETKGVSNILSYSSTFNNKIRKLSVTFKVDTEYAQSELTSVTIGVI